MRLFLLTPTLILWAACASNGGSRTNAPNDSPVGPNDSGSKENNDTSTELAQKASVWYGLSASLKVTDLSVEANFTLNFYTDLVSDGPACSVEINDKEQAKQPYTPDESIVVWWESSGLYSSESSQCDGLVRLPKNLQIGLGQIHESLLPFLSAAGLDNTDESKELYGAYIGFNPNPSSADTPGTAYVLGYAQRNGASSDTDALSGEFSLQGVFLFPLDPETDTVSDTGS
jgi:hypothetical protein